MISNVESQTSSQRQPNAHMPPSCQLPSMTLIFGVAIQDRLPSPRATGLLLAGSRENTSDRANKEVDHAHAADVPVRRIAGLCRMDSSLSGRLVVRIPVVRRTLSPRPRGQECHSSARRCTHDFETILVHGASICGRKSQAHVLDATGDAGHVC